MEIISDIGTSELNYKLRNSKVNLFYFYLCDLPKATVKSQTYFHASHTPYFSSVLPMHLYADRSTQGSENH